MKNFEASIASADGKVRLVVFNAANGNIMSLIEVSGVSLFFSSLTKLSEIADHLLKAKQEIERIKISD